MRGKKLLSVILCLAFVVSLFPFSTVAQSEHFVVEDDEQNISVSEDVYAEQGNERDKGIGKDIIPKDEIEITSANMMQMMTLEDTGDEDNPIKGWSERKTSYEFPEVTGKIEITLPRAEGEEGEDSTTWCDISFTPIIEEGDIPFYIVKDEYLYDFFKKENVYTIRENDIDLRASIKEEFFIKNPDLVEVGETRITFSEGYDKDTRSNLSYEIYFEVDFHSKEKYDEEKITLQYTVRVYDSPLLAVEVDDAGEISTHYGYWAAYIEEDIWNSTVEVNISRKTVDNLYDEPMAGVLTNIFYYWGASDYKYCVFKPTKVGEETDAEGKATFEIGDGSEIAIKRSINLPAPALYGKLVKTDDDLSQYYTYPDLKDFEGILKVKVVNTAKEPLEGRTVQFWGGAKYDALGGGITDKDGIAEIRYPSSTTSEDRTELIMTELPTFDLKWNITQVIDNPSRIVKGHKAPLYLSPEVYVSERYSEIPHVLLVKDVKLQVYDVNNPEKIVLETSPMSFREKYLDSEIGIAAHRAYIKISPEDWADKRLGIRAVVPNNDEGARDKYQVRGYIEDLATNHELYVPKKTFTFAFVPLQVGAEENNSSISYGSQSKQKEFIRKIFPAPIKFVEKSPMFIAKPRFSTHGMYVSRVFRELGRTQKLFSDKYDLYIGLTPTGFLPAAGLQESGYYGMNWEFLGAVHGAVLVDPKQALAHTTIHEFMHTLDFSDVYPTESNKYPSANGHNGTPLINTERDRQPYQGIMYDHAPLPWPTEGEYNALLEYATKLDTREKSFLRMNVLSGEAESEVLLLSGSIEDVRSNNRKVYFDPIIKHTGDVDINNDFVNNPYVIQTLDSNSEIISQYFFSDYEYEGKYYANFIANLPADGVQAIEIGKQEYGDTQIFKRYEYSANAPVASITGPSKNYLSGDFMITWEASDADGDNLLSEIQVSSDGGNTWDILAVNIPHNADGEYSHKLNAENFPKGGNYKFKVIVTDGMHSTEAVSSKFTIEGYELKPILNLTKPEATIKVKPGTKEAVAYLELANSGREELNVEFSPDDETSTFISPLFIKEYTIYPGQNQLIAIPLILPGEAEDILNETVKLISNDPDNPTTNFTINVEYTNEALKPELASFSTTPSDFKEGVSGSAIRVTFEAYAMAGQSDLEATINIDKDGNEILKEQMVESYHQSGIYTFSWEEDEGLSVGNYGVYIGLKDIQPATESEPEKVLERERTEGEYDFTFSIKAPNAPPVFEEPQVYENDLGVVKRGETITIPYQVSDPDGDPLEINVYSNLLNRGLMLIEDTGNSGEIKWTANYSGAHSIYLTATDPSRNSTTVMFNITELEDLNLFTISLEANSSDGGQVYGNGIYNPGEYVIVEAVPEETYEFISWTENDIVVSEDPEYMFKADKDRDLVANFEEAAVFDYYIEDNEVIITGFADVKVLEDIVIPNEIEGYLVTGIGDTAFYLKNIKSVNLPDTLTNIGTNAFRSNQLTEVIIPNSVNIIGDYTFGNNEDLAEVVILNGDTVLGEGAFSGCSPDLIIYGVPGSSANIYATTNNITFKDINEYGGEIPAAKYAITVTDVVGGTATVTTNPATSAAEGATVTVNIGSVQSGKQFKAITVIDADSNNVSINKIIAGEKYTFIMPAKAVSINVELQDASIVVPEKYTVTLNGIGTGAAGAGDYAENETVTINAGNRSGYTFKGWTSTDVTFSDANAQTTTFTMPAKNVTITATWKTVSGGESDSESSSGNGGGHSQAQIQYSIINNNESAQKTNGKMKLSSQEARAGETVFITIEPDLGYKNTIPTVLDQNGNPIKVTENSDGTYSFLMPRGEVSIDTKYSKIDYFDDVDQNDWYDEAAWFCAAHGLMNGTGERKFDGDADTTRAMLVVVLYRLSQSNERGENIFADVEDGKWYTEAITWAAKNNIVSGYGNGNFGPEDILTREQMVAILHKYSKFMGYDISNKNDLGAYHDADNISHWAIAQMQWAVGNGLIKGVGNNLVSPQTGANRAQFAVIMQRYYTDFVERIID